MKHGLRGRHGREQGLRRPELHAIRRAEERVGQIGARFSGAADRVSLRHGAAVKARELREHKPHPVRLLAAAAQLRQRTIVHAGLRVDVPLPIVRIVVVHVRRSVSGEFGGRGTRNSH